MNTMTGQLENTEAVPAAAPAVSGRHPIAFWFFFWGEFSERASFYGMRTILALYLTSALGFSALHAGPIQYRFKAAAYFLPLLGGFVADRFFGKYWTIVGFSVPYVLGHFILGIPQPVAVYVALALLAGGSGVIKPNISTLMGQTYDEQRPGQDKLLSSAFLWFYFAINVGALISTFALPAIRDSYTKMKEVELKQVGEIARTIATGGQVSAEDAAKVKKVQHAYAVAFQFPAWLMVAALLVFAAGKPFYAKDKIVRQRASPEERQERWKTLGKLAGVFALIIFYWVPYEHNDTIWVYFIRDYVYLPYLPKIPFLGLKADQQIPPDQVQSLNPLCVLIFAPLCVWFFRKADPNGRVFTTANRMLLGFLMGVISSGLMWSAGALAASSPTAHAGSIVPDAQKISIFWPAAAYIALTLGEVLIYGTGLELAYTAAPARMKGFITGCFLATIMIADLINDRMSQLYGGSLEDVPERRGPFSPAWFFGLMTLIAIAAMFGFYFVGRRLKRQSAAEEMAPTEKL